MKCLILAILLIVSGLQESYASKVWWEYGIASATVGYDKDSKQWVQDRYSLAVLSTAELSERMYIVHPKCSPGGPNKLQKLVEIRDNFKTRFDELPSLDALTNAGAGMTTEAIAQAQFKRLSALESLVWEALEKTRAAYLACGLQERELNGITLALVRRHCGRPGTSVCKTNVPAFGGSPSEVRFAALLDWIDARLSASSNAALAQAAVGYNKPILLSFSGTNTAVLTNALSSTFEEASKWPLKLTAPDQAALAAEAIRKVRLDQKDRLSGTLPRLLMLSDRSTVAILDAISSPREAFDRIERRASELKTTVLSGVSDEVARTRINECYKFLAKTELQDLSLCAGYQVDKPTLINCLSKGECVPTLTTTSIRRDVAILAESLTIKQLAGANLLGRIPVKFEQLVVVSSKCKDTGGTAFELAKCLNVNALPEKAVVFESCVRNAKTNAARLACAGSAGGIALPDSLIKCASNTKDQAACLLGSALPEIDKGVASVQACLQADQSNSKLKACLSKLPISGDAAVIAKCLAGNDKNETAKLALCLGGDLLPSGVVRQAVACFADGNGDVATTAACLAKETLPAGLKDVSKLIVCAAESQGDPMGTSICAASDSMNAELRIALQCAVSSGGEPTASATCTFGRLTMKELQQCSGKKFGDEGCFGKGNEIQKAAKLLFGSEISSNSVVGQVATFQLNAMRDVIGFYEASFKEGGKLLQNISSGVDATGKAAEKLVSAAGKEAERGIQNVGKAAEKAVQDVGNAAGSVVQGVVTVIQNILPPIRCCRF